MQEVTKQVNDMSMEVTTRHVQMCIQEQRVWIQGRWQWELHSDSVYCSDVMSFPDDFEGTRSIIHPDDLDKVKSALRLLQDGETLPLQFRIITTYGDVKTLTGEQVALDLREPVLLPAEEHQPWETALKTWINPREEAQLRLRTDLYDPLERLYSLGSWYINADINEAFYSDNMFRLHGLAPQSLNAHANTFNAFIHPEDQAVVTDTLDKAFINRVPVHLHYRIVKANSEERYVQLVTSWRFNSKGQQLLTGQLQDVTELQLEADKLAEAQVHLLFQKSILQLNEQNSNSGNWYINLFTRKTTYSDNYFRIYGLKQQMLPNFNAFLNLVHPDDRPAVKEAIDRLYGEHVLPEMEYRIIRPDGKTRYLRQAGKLIVHGGKELLVAGTVQDITVQKALEHQMKELRDGIQLRHTIYELSEDLAHVSTIVWHLPDGSMHWTDGFYKLLGYKTGTMEPSERLLYRAVHPADLKVLKQALALVLNNQPHDPVRFRVITRNGISEVELSFRHLQSQPVIVGIAQDISLSASLGRQLADRNGFATLLSNTIPDTIIVTSADHTILTWNHQAEQKTGIKESDALNENLFEVLPRLKDEDYVARLQQVLQGDRAAFFQLRDGYQKGYYDLHLAPLHNEQQEVTGVLHVVHDVSKERELQLRLGERLNFIENLVEASVDRIIVLDRNMNYLYWNKQAETYYNLRKERVLGKNIMETFPAFRTDPTYQEFRRVLKGETVHLSARLETESTEYYETYLIPVKGEKGDVLAVLWIVHDLSKERQLQQEQLRTLRLLQDEHHRLVEAQQIGHIGSYEGDLATGTFTFSDEMFRLFGKEPQSFTPMLDWIDSVSHPEDARAVRGILDKAIADKTDYQYYLRIYRHCGEERFVFSRGRVICDENGTALKIAGTAQDITEQQKAETEIRARQELLQATMNSSMDMIQVFEAVRDDNGVIVDFKWVLNNHKAETFFGDVIGKNLLQLNPGVVASGLFEQFVQVTETGLPIDHEVYYNYEQFNGWFHQRLVKMGDGFVMNASDITERKKAGEEILRLKDEIADKVSDKYRTLFNSMDEGYCIIQMIYDKNGKAVDWRFLEVNPAFEKHNGLVYATGKTVRELTPDIEPKWMAIYNRVAETGESIRFEEDSEALQRIFDLYAFRVGAPEERKVAVLFTDITQRKKAERALYESEQKARALNSLVPVLLWNVDAKGNETTLNERWLEYTGQTVKESQNGGWINSIHPDDQPNTQRVVADAFANPHEFEREQRIRRHDGTYRWFLMRQVPIVDDKGDVVQWFGAAVDIHDRKLAEEALHQAEDAIKHQQQAELFKNLNLLKQAEEVASIGSWEYCPSEDTMQWSNGMYSLFDLKPGVKVSKETYLKYVVKEERLKAKTLVQQLSEGVEMIDEVLTIETKAGTRKVLRIKGIWVKDDSKPARMLGVDLDITELMRTEETLKALNQVLDQRNKELEAKNEELANFSFIASHDLREPLRKIHTFSDWMLQREKENLSQMGQDYLKRMTSSVERMDMLIDDVLVLTRLHANRSETEDVDLNVVLRSIKAELKDVIRQKHVQLQVDTLPIIVAHKSQVHQLFKNLITNAIKFQTPENTPQVTVTYEDVPAAEILERGLPGDQSYGKVCVSDNGIGIDKRYVRKIFQIFQRLHPRTEYEGTGIGLTICKKVMENHKGLISVDSTPGKGSTFSCYFPIAAQ